MADVSMPQLGETVTEGTITQWFKAVGDSVEVDEPLFEVSTDQVDSEVPSPASGVLLVMSDQGLEHSPMIAPRRIDATRKSRHDPADFERAWPINWGKVRMEDYL